MTHYGPRHTTVDRDPAKGHRQSSENARDVLEALGRKLSAHASTVARYTASGSTSARIRLEASSTRPLAVALIHAALADDPAAPLSTSATLNFVYAVTEQTIEVFEPAGLEAGRVYTLTFLVVEA